MIPSAFVTLDAIPTTVSGKIDRKRLPAPDWNQAAATAAEFVAPQTAAESSNWRRSGARSWSIEQVGVHDDFFELGGNSLLALRLVSRVRAAFSVDLPLVTLFTAPRLGDLAARIVALQGAGPVGEVLPFWINQMSTSRWRPASNGNLSLVPLRSGGSVTPLFCIHGLGGMPRSFGR